MSRNLWDKHPYPYRLADAEEWIQYAMQQEPETIFAIASATEVIGCIGMLPQSDVARLSAEVGYRVGEPFWGQGIATGALKALTGYAFTELGLVRLYATVMEWNPASARAPEKPATNTRAGCAKAPSKTAKSSTSGCML